jgi:hypothetical protein
MQTRYYKGFNPDFTCRGTQYELGKFTTKQGSSDVLVDEDIPLGKEVGISWRSSEWLFSACDLYNIPHEYTEGGKGIICEVEIGGDYAKPSGLIKSKAIKPLRILSEEEIKDLLFEQQIKDIHTELNLDVLGVLQDALVGVHVGGSLGLLLRGFKMPKRFSAGKGDIDIVLPYYQRLPDIEGWEVRRHDIKNSGNDFDYGVGYSKDGRFVKIDVRIDPKQYYDVIEWENRKYNVSSHLHILEAKLRYALQGNAKHQRDIQEMMTPGDPYDIIKSSKDDIYKEFIK